MVAGRFVEPVIAKAMRLGVGLCSSFSSPSLSILIFHRVHAQADGIFLNEPDAKRFEHLMRFVASAFRVMPLREAICRLEEGTLPSSALAITFDDGYADNAEVALPILQRCGLTACFFVSTGFLDGGRMWNDSVIECVRGCPYLEIDLDDFGLGKYPLAHPAERRRAIDALLRRIKYLNLVERDTACARLQRLCGVPHLPTDLMMRSEQICALHRSGMEIGAHTVNHPILTAITLPEAEREIVEGRARLESIIDAPVDLFAYPNGKPAKDYDYSHVSLVRRLGFRGAVSTAAGAGRSGDDLFQLPRFTPWGDLSLRWAGRLFANRHNTTFEVATDSVCPREAA